MSKVKIEGHGTGTGTFTLTTPSSNTDRTITLPDGTGTLAFTTGDDDKLPLAGGAMSGTITNFASTGIDDNASAVKLTVSDSGINVNGAVTSLAIKENDAGNVGIGRTPETTTSTYTNLQVGGTGTVLGYKTQVSGSDFILGNNVYYNSGFKRMYNEQASMLEQLSGTMNLKVSAAGSADSAITWTTAMNIDNSGHITMPSQPSAFVNGGGNTYIQVNDGSPAPFSNIVNQTGGSNYNTSNYRYTAPVAGWYQVSFGILSNGDISQEWMVNKNGTHIFRCYGKDRSWYQTGFYYCSASDYLEVVSGGSNSGNLYANTGASTYSWASYRLLG